MENESEKENGMEDGRVEIFDRSLLDNYRLVGVQSAR